jgi:hypothetical protein
MNSIHWINLIPSIPFVAIALIWSIAWGLDLTGGE